MKAFVLFICLLVSFSFCLFSKKPVPELTFSANPPTLKTSIAVFDNGLWFMQPEIGKILKISSKKINTYTIPDSSDCLIYPESNKLFYLKKGKLFKAVLKKKFISYPLKLKKSYYSANKFGEDQILLINFEEFTTSVFSIKKNKIIKELRLSDLSYPLNNDLYADVIMSDFNKLAVINIFDRDKKFINEFANFQFPDNFISKINILGVDEDFIVNILLIGKGMTRIITMGQNGELLQEIPLEIPIDKLICYSYSEESNSFYYLLFEDEKYFLYKCSL
ncbi:hypothetical protein KAJ27_01415 [bacterium]|nr:hypothetical protein [bacterium]